MAEHGSSLKFADHRSCRGLTEGLSAVVAHFERMGRPRKLKAGELLYARGDPTETAFLVLRGRIRLVADGRIESYGPEELVGELCFCAVAARQEDAVATTAAEVVALTPAQLLAAVRQSEEVARCLLETFCQRLAGARARAGEDALAPAQFRVGRCLLELAQVEGLPDGGARILARRPTQAELARAALISRERASKSLSEFRRQGLISYGRVGPLRVEMERLRLYLTSM